MLHAHQKIEGAFFGRRGKAVEVIESSRTTWRISSSTGRRARQAIVGAQWDEDLVADAAGLDDDAARVANFERAASEAIIAAPLRGRLARRRRTNARDRLTSLGFAAKDMAQRNRERIGGVVGEIDCRVELSVLRTIYLTCALSACP